jgi:transposase InsO family protein
VRSPWQNGIAERWVGSARRELVDHVIPLNQHHLRQLAREYLAYYHQDRTHIGLGKTTPANRPIERSLNGTSAIHAQARIGGLHHRYSWTEAA